MGLWESIDGYQTAMTDGNFLLSYLKTTGYYALLYFGTVGSTVSIGEHEVPGSIAPIAFSVTFRELNSQFINLIEVDTMFVSSSAYASSGAFTLTTSRSFDGKTPKTSTISYVDGEVGTKVDKAPVGDSGNRVLCSFSGTVPGGTPFYAVAVRTQKLEGGFRQ
jgi:hypothetical protein